MAEGRGGRGMLRRGMLRSRGLGPQIPGNTAAASGQPAHLSKSRRLFQGNRSGMAFPRKTFALQILPPSSIHGRFIHLTCPFQKELCLTNKTYEQTTVASTLPPGKRMRKQREKLSVNSVISISIC